MSDNDELNNDEIDIDALANEVASGSDDQALADEWAAAMEEAGVDPDAEEDDDDGVVAAPLAEMREGFKQSKGAPDLDIILDIPVVISMEVGNTQIPIRNLLQLN